MAHQGYDLRLTRYDERGWRATFYTSGMEHSPTSATGTGWEPTPWHATQRAAWDALRQASRDGLDGESFEIPDLATSDVHPNGPAARVQRDSFHQQLVFGEDRVAGVARFAVAGSTPDRSDAVMRQATVLEFATDEEVESFLVDSGLAGQPHTRQPDSPGSRRRSVNP
jgi:hypothetical protein